MAICFHSPRNIAYKGSVPNPRLWVFFSASFCSGHLRGCVCWARQWGGGAVYPSEATSPFSILWWLSPNVSGKAEWSSLKKSVLAKLAISAFEKNSLEETSWWAHFSLLPYPPSLGLNQLPPGLWLVSVHTSVFIWALITSALCQSFPVSCEHFPGLRHLGHPRHWQVTRHIL